MRKNRSLLTFALIAIVSSSLWSCNENYYIEPEVIVVKKKATVETFGYVGIKRIRLLSLIGESKSYMEIYEFNIYLRT